ncbi:MAG: hypothetical protein ABSH04_05710 [Acidimicrobiales bacterium]|jgi:hypothetical protein
MRQSLLVHVLRRPRVAVALAQAVVLAAAGTVTFAATTSSGVAAAPSGESSSSIAQGVYTGAGNTSGVASFAATTGVHVSIASDYLDGSSWGAMVGSPGSPPWVLMKWQGTAYQMVVGIPMNPNAGPNSTVLANGAAGAYDSYYTTLAQNAVALGLGNTIWRPGWEFDQQLVTTDADAINYAAYYRNIVDTMRSVPGQSFKFTWDGALDGTSNGNAWSTLDAYPGDGYVDYVALDFYDQTWTSSCGLPFDNTMTQAQESCAWSEDQSLSLARLSSFASAHSKPVAFPEWGVISRSDGHGGGDDPYWMTNFTSWMTNPANNVAFASYFDFNSGGDSILTDYPASLAVYQQALGTTTTTSPTTTTTTSPATSGAPAAPGGLTAIASGGTVTLRWSNPPDAQGDDVYRDGVEIAWPGWPDPVVTSYVDTNPGAGTHTYYVTAYDGSGEGAPSNVDSVVVAPAAVSGLTATVDGTTVTLTWTNPADTDGDDVYVDGTKIAWPGWPDPVVTSYTITNAQSGTHTYAVTAYNGGGEGPATSIVVSVTGTPAAPGGLSATTDGGTVTLRWSNPSDAQGDDVYRDGVEIAWPGWPDPALTSFVDTSPGAGTHTYYVTAYDGSGEGAPSNVVSVTVAP